MESFKSVPKRRKRVVKYIIDNPDDIAFLTVRELATKLKVNPATIVRACKELGFAGFTDLKNHQKELYRKRLTGYDSMLDKLQTDSPLEDVIKSSFATDIDVLTRTASQISWQSIVDVVKKISQSNRTYIIGLEAARSIAIYLTSELRTYLPNVQEVVHGNGYLFDFMRHFQKDDVVFAISFGRCIRQTVLAIKEAFERDITTISITDSKLSPLYKYSHISLLTTCSGETHFSAFIGAWSLSNAIITCCAELEREHSLEQLKKVKEQWEEANIYYSEF